METDEITYAEQNKRQIRKARNECSVSASGSYTIVQFGRITVAFSYRTPIAVHVETDGRAIRASRENDWGPTTGKHLAAAEREFGLSKSDRMPSDRFDTLLGTVLP